MENIIVAAVILGIISLSIMKIIIEKRKGVKCVGCSLSSDCTSKSIPNNHTFSKNSMLQINVKQVS